MFKQESDSLTEGFVVMGGNVNCRVFTVWSAEMDRHVVWYIQSVE